MRCIYCSNATIRGKMKADKGFMLQNVENYFISVHFHFPRQIIINKLWIFILLLSITTVGFAVFNRAVLMWKLESRLEQNPLPGSILTLFTIFFHWKIFCMTFFHFFSAKHTASSQMCHKCYHASFWGKNILASSIFLPSRLLSF